MTTDRAIPTIRSAGRIAASGIVRAFTLVELLVVISIIAVTLTVILPLFARVVESNNYASAINTVSATLARVSTRGVEGGVLFLFDPVDEQYTLLPLEYVGPNGSLGLDAGTPRKALIFKPAPGFAPVTLPKGTLVYGLSLLHDDSSLATAPTEEFAWYQNEAAFADTSGGRRYLSINPWLFPRNDIRFYVLNFDDADLASPDHPVNSVVQGVPDDNPFRQCESFFVWFGKDGTVKSASSMPVGVRDAYLEFPDLPYDPTLLPTDPVYVFDDPQLFDPEVYYDGANQWPVFSPELQMRPVEQLAIVDTSRLIEGTGVRQPWWLRAEDADWTVPEDKESFENNELVDRVSRWIDANAEIISFNRNTGQIVRR